MTLSGQMICSGVCAALFILLWWNRKRKKESTQHLFLILEGACLICTLYFGISAGHTVYELRKKGMPVIDAIDYPVKEMKLALAQTMDQTPDLSRENLNHKVVILYRFGCSSCEKIYPELSEIKMRYPSDRVVFLSSRSPLGRTVVEEAHILNVPAVLVVDTSDTEHTMRVLYHAELLYPDGNEKVFNKQAFQIALQEAEKQF